MTSNFIHKIFENNIDNFVHLQFQKFSKGIFKDRACAEVNISKGKFSISTTYEYANGFVRMLAEKLKGKTPVKGVIVSTLDLSKDIEFKDKKQFMGIKQYVIEKEMDGKEILAICDKIPNAFMALSFRSDNTELKIKPKAPKSAKPSLKGEGTMKINFCKIITSDKEIVRDILFDVSIESAKKFTVYHTFVINDIILPKGEKDFEKIRILAKRKGKIIRKMIIDEKETIKEKEFIA